MGEATRCARVIVEELLGRGINDVVLSPGSRSSPLAYELFEADRIGLLRLHVRIDERSSGFLALGLAKASGAPVAVLTTSGTAVANLHPAVLEAAHSNLPLVLLTADRPGSMTHTGANQTTDQRTLFAAHVRAAAHLEDAVGTGKSWRFQVARLMVAAIGSRSAQPGPVHLNVGFSEPLSPQPLEPSSPPELVIEPLLLSPEVTRLSPGPQTVVLAGDGPPSTGAAARELAASAELPLLAEPSSNARVGAQAIGTYRLLLQSDLADEIERVVVFGHPTLSRPVTRLLQRDDVEVIMVCPYASWVDPGTNATRVTAAISLDPGDAGWLSRWQDADRRLRLELDRLLAGQRHFTGPALAAALWASLGERDTLVVGSSNPIRDLDLAAVGGVAPTVYANRGLAGIDGMVSTAVGVALAVERPCHALMGDITFVHDSNGLVLGPQEPRPNLRIVVANDDGGSIFATLEQGTPAHSPAFERLFGTAHGTQIAALAQAHSAGYRAATSAESLAGLLEEPPIGIEVVEAAVDRQHRRTLHSAITALVASL
ncbi:MAG TPA: 2-succinyl-5-enolpyruvyl-6-hydroxy-3-cyclohexene-1-carboxylic-acid synthase [Propionibacteriaceae bacterium]|nr:2-succinyl-5-enolpyruvyl-6-hydroxy-3-cyclohexene-1-carboxylic-acid synthase [Propionibacteriaceae bacterium]